MIKCHCCQSANTKHVLKRDNVPVHQNLLLKTMDEAKRVNRGQIELYFCRDCGFVFNAAFDPNLLAYGDQYDNTQTNSKYFINYMTDLVRHIIEDYGIKQKQVVEVGCGKGYFLKQLCAAGNNRGLGFDPSYDVDGENPNVRVERKFYGPGLHPDFIAHFWACRHVIEHISHPVDFLTMIRQALGSGSNALVFFETPSVHWIFENHVIWDFFYEHCSYFTKTSLSHALGAAGFTVEECALIFESQYLGIYARPGIKKEVKLDPNFEEAIDDYIAREGNTIYRWKESLGTSAKEGAIAVWGAAAKGTTFVNLLDPKQNLINALIDVNPNKQGKFIAGTGHPIVSYKDIAKRGIKSVIVMNPNYRREIEELLQGAGIKVKMIGEEVLACD